MRKIFKGTILLFIITLVLSTFRADALRNIGVTVTIPAFKINVTGASGIVKETDSRQYFTTSVSKYNNDNSNALVEVQTYNQTNGKYSAFISVPVGQKVTIPNGYNTTLGVAYKLIAQNSVNSVHTVNFGGIWNIDN